ncbi:MAG: response regulator [Gammaproteobacteria bacterium]|nr:response regulator [Gammaproteobacteria bacterium]
MGKKTTRILLVDGSSVTRALLTKTLLEELADVDITAVETGKEAMEKVQQSRFDLLSTALMLPDMDGLALCRTIRQSNELSYLPVIVVSGDADTRLLREGFASGVTDYFDKSNGYKAFGRFVQGFIQRNSGMVGQVLFVEDSATAAAVTCNILKQQGLGVLHVNTAEEAMSYIAGSSGDNTTTPIDLVITDFYLEGKMTGGDLLYAIRATLQMSQQELPVLVLTSNDDQKTQVEVFHAGANDFVTKPIIEEILIARVRALLLIKHQYDALKQQAETMRWIAATDSLTGVRSKRYLIDNGEDYLRDPDKQPVWAMLLDIDNFKQLNDNKGHIAGDHVLADVGDKLSESFPDAMVVRFGGEEFCILMANIEPEPAIKRAEKLRQDIMQLKPAGMDITISIGLVCSLDFPKEHLTQFLALADKALYAAKDRGRNRVCLHTDDGIVDSPWHDEEPIP